MPIKYLGSKRRLVPLLVEAVRSLAPAGTVLDLFSGTSRLGHALKRAGYRVLANDHLAFASTIARATVEADREDWEEEARDLLSSLERIPPAPGWFTECYCRRSRFFHPRNGARIEAIREAILRLAPPPELEAVLLVSLLEAADRVDSTTGLQMAYLKEWAPRALGDLCLRLPDLLPRAASGKGRAHSLDAREAARLLDADVAYLDPPYNQHSYLGNYHVWETLVRWDRPPVYGTACKRADCRERRSDFNRRRSFGAAFADVVLAVRARHLVVSFSDEGFVDRAWMEALLSARGEVCVLSREHPRYVGARIGIHSPAGVKVGTVGRLSNVEHVFVVRDCRPPAATGPRAPAGAQSPDRIEERTACATTPSGNRRCAWPSGTSRPPSCS